MKNKNNRKEETMSKLYAIHAYDEFFGGMHGVEEYEVIKAENDEEANLFAEDLSRELIEMYGMHMETGWGQEAIDNGYPEGTSDYERYIEERAEDDIAYSVYEITKETNLPIKELANLLQADPEDFIKEYCAEEN